MDYQNLTYENQAGIGIVTLNRPKALNALNAALMTEIDALATALAKDESVKVIIITGSGDKAFVAGADITEMKPMSAVEGRNWGKFGQATMDKIENLPQPVIAAVNGFALGGGCELAMMCDFIIAGDRAKFGQPEINLGVIPGMGGSQRLTRAVGKAKAMEMCLTGRMMGAEEAERAGLVARIVPADSLLEEAAATAELIASKSLVASQMVKEAVNAAFETTLAQGINFERRLFYSGFASNDQAEGMAAFVEKRDPTFTHS